MIMKKWCVLMIAFVLSVPSAYGITLEELQRSAVSNRDIVKRYQADVEQRGQQIREVKGEFLPSFDAGYTFNRLDDDGLYEYKENDAAFGTVSWNVFAGFKDKYNLKATETLQEIDRLSLSALKQDIQRVVALNYLTVYRARANLKVTEDAVNLYRDRYRDVQLKYEVGILKKNDLLKLKVELDNAVQDARRAGAEVSKSLNDLSRQTGVVVSLEKLDFGCFDALPAKAGYPEYEAQLMARRSEIKALVKAKEAAGYQVMATKSSLYPRADLSVSYGNNHYDDYFYGSSDLNEAEVRFQGTVSINLFDGMKKYARISQARIEEKKAGYDLTELEDDLKTRLKNALLDLDVAVDNLEVAQSSQLEAEENLRVTDLSFKQGLSTSTDILDAIFFLSRARFNIIDAYTQVFGSYFELQRLVEGFEQYES
ncbi:MAG: TolC family protein [Desulfobacterales bacterium]|nr:TolC family protein [Desulfobacterales bacterium]MDD4393102.1 TolC family protein [Desulfobacterales bacterium]